MCGYLATDAASRTATSGSGGSVTSAVGRQAGVPLADVASSSSRP